MDICGDGDSSPAVINNDDQVVNINDLIEVIANDDPMFEASRLTNTMYRPNDTTPSGVSRPTGSHGKPYVKIVEQPASKSLRFRYECEGRSAGSIPGVNSTSERKTYPSIEICRFKGEAIVVASCVFKDPDIVTNTVKYKTHPHNLVGKEHCRDGVYSIKVSGENPVISFSNLGIQCVKRKDIKEALNLREKINVDPYKMGFKHRDHPQSIELNALRLCFQVFLLNADKSMVPLAPIVSEVIYDKKAMSDLAITRVSHISGPVTGNTEIILLCEKVNKDEIDVIFYEMDNGTVVWEAPATVLLVHKMHAIVLLTPPYHQPQSEAHHQVHFELRRRADVTRSAPVRYEYTPLYTDSIINGKRKKVLFSSEEYKNDNAYRAEHGIKLEPKDKTPPHPMGSPAVPYSMRFSETGPTLQNLKDWTMPVEKATNMLNVPNNNPFVQSSMNPFNQQSFASQDFGWQGNYMNTPMSNLSTNVNLSPMRQTLSPMHLGPASVSVSVSASPHADAVSPMSYCALSPAAGDPSISMVNNMQQNNYVQAPAEGGEGDGPPQTISGLLRDVAELGQLGQLGMDLELADSLRNLNTSGLLSQAYPDH